MSASLPSARGLDTNILCYALDPAFPEHARASSLLSRASSEFRFAINPTTVHEAYHTLVYKQKWLREDASERILSIIRQKHFSFLNQTKSITQNALHLADKYELGGRDALILSNYLMNNINQMYTHDQSIITLGKVTLRTKELAFTDPLH